MAKNILLLFLSDVKIKDGIVFDAPYKNVGGEPALTTNESAVRYLLQKSPLDKLFIFASKKIRKPIAGYRTGDSREQTHLDFFLERVKKFWSDADWEVYPYDEDKTGAENLRSVAEMAGRIQEFAAGDKVTLHVDLTGGMRDVNIMMLDLTRLLDYSGLEIKHILYSDFGKKMVVELKNIYDLFQLIAGVEEFVNFGSVKALQIYYRDKSVSEPLQKLLDAMKNFAEAIKLCHYGQFRDAIINLHDAVNDFDKYTSEDVEDILMARLIGRIKEDYHNVIINRELDDAQVIRWCLNHDYLQQALTLYTERIPEYLGEKGILLSTDVEATKGVTNYWFNMFSEGKSNRHNLEDGKNIFCKEVKSAAKSMAQGRDFSFDDWLAALNGKLAPLDLHCDGESDFRAQFEYLDEIFKNPRLMVDLSSAELKPVRKILDNLPQEIAEKFVSAKWGKQRCKILSNFFVGTMLTDDVPKYFIGSNFIKYPKAIKIHQLLNEGFFSIGIPKELFLSIVDRYFRIKDERNHSNHAREDYGEFRTAEKLRKAMSDGLDEIRDALPAQ